MRPRSPDLNWMSSSIAPKLRQPSASPAPDPGWSTKPSPQWTKPAPSSTSWRAKDPATPRSGKAASTHSSASTWPCLALLSIGAGVGRPTSRPWHRKRPTTFTPIFPASGRMTRKSLPPDARPCSKSPTSDARQVTGARLTRPCASRNRRPRGCSECLGRQTGRPEHRRDLGPRRLRVR